MSLSLHQPFEIRMSSNVEELVFSQYWDPYTHYYAVFNAQRKLIPSLADNNTSWAMIADWRQWLARIPEAERLCVRKINVLIETGMTRFVTVSDDHPVARWQTEKVNSQFPELQCAITSSFEEAHAWLARAGFDVAFNSVEFDQTWLSHGTEFEDILVELNVAREKYACGKS